MQADWLSRWQGADWVVQGVFSVLVVLSILTWTLIVVKSWQFGRQISLAKTQRRRLEAEMPSVAKGMVCPDLLRDLHLREWRTTLEGGLTLLATMGATSPFIGLLGTVWGIMHALRQLGSQNAVSLDLVAGPVAEALVATAVGLFVAIPAVVGYNLLVRQLRRLMVLLEGNALLRAHWESCSNEVGHGMV